MVSEGRSAVVRTHLDVGILTMMSGLRWTDISRPDARALVNEGTPAERFVGQELLAELENSILDHLKSTYRRFAVSV
jgi:hypothetical protein